MSLRNITVIFLYTILLLMANGCAVQTKQVQAWWYKNDGRQEQALDKLKEASAEQPRDAELRRDYVSNQSKWSNEALDDAREKLQSGDFDAAEKGFRNAIRLDKNNSRAKAGLDDIEQARRLADVKQEARRQAAAGQTDDALRLLNQITTERPTDLESRKLKQALESEVAGNLQSSSSLNALYSKPISLEFRDVPILQALEALARTTNINFVLDKDVRQDLRATLFLKQTGLEDAINMLLATNRLEKKILNERSVMIYPSDPAKTKEYQDLVVRAFYLDNSDAKQVASTLKTLLKLKEAIPDEKLNMVLVRDTPDAVALAERIVSLHEVPEPEVMLEVEVLEVTRNRLTALGVQWPNQLSLTPLNAASGTALTLQDLKSLNDSRLQAGIGSATLTAKKIDSDVNLLANPRIRVRNKVKAKILIGNKIPIITTTATSTGFVSESVQYLDVGLKLDVEPKISASDEVTIKIGLEVSSLGNEVRSASGTVAYQIGTRNADTLLRLRDGETQILAGLLNDEERSGGNRIPFLGDIPLLGRLFGSQQDERNKTEIILSITPRIVQAAIRPPLNRVQFWSGTESNLRTRPLSLQSTNKRPGTQQPVGASDVSGPTTDQTPRPAIGSVQAAATNVSLTWGAATPTFKQGEVSALPIRLKSDGGIRSLPFQLAFDPELIDVVRVEAGDFFNAKDGAPTVTTNTDAGKLFASVLQNSVNGSTGEGSAAVIFIRPKRLDKSVEIRLVAATPISSSNTVINPILPPPWVLEAK